MINKLPNEKKIYLQNNRTNVFPIGNLWSTFGVDLQSNLGAFRASPRLIMNTTTTDDADLGCPVAFKWFDTKIWAICDTHIFSNTGLPSASFTDDASTGFQTNYIADESDMEVFNGTLCATTTNGLYSKAPNGAGTGAWTKRDTINTGSQHNTCYFKRYDRLYYADSTCKIKSIDTTWAVASPGSDYAINLAPVSTDEYTITSMKTTSQFIWVGTINRLNKGGVGHISQWDGISAQTSNEFTLNNSQGCLAIAIDPRFDAPYALDTNGVLSAWNGSGFAEVGRLPFPFSQLPYNVDDTDAERYVHFNGMYFTKNGTLRVVINNRANDGNVIENIPSGIWEWTKDTGFVHTQPFTYTPRATTTVTDWGQNRIARVGALVSMNIPTNASSDGTVMVGATVYTDASSTKSAIFYDNSLNTAQKKAYYVSDWMESQAMADSWDVLWTSYRKALAASDSIAYKYRIEETDPTEGTITWTSTTTFTILNSAVDVSAYWTSGTGGEVEILRGTGGGLCAHITNAVLAAGTWTVTIDETATGATGTATARFQKWIKLQPAEALSSTSVWSQYAIGTDSTPRIQIKGCFTWTGNGEFYKSNITSNEDIKTK